ncbi:ankyrin [Hypoxylon sp. FL0543]|nr:ankyrin [Hypoxylon sp. FL0543]
MAASSTTRRIPLGEWEKHERRIRELYLDQDLSLLGDDGVISTMKKEGFNATKSQYETQLRKWNVRKYMSSKEWTGLIPTVQQSRERGETKEIRPLGRVMPPSRIERACRRYAPKTHQNAESSPRDDRGLSVPTESRRTSVERVIPEIIGMSYIEPLDDAVDLSTLGGLELVNFDAVNHPVHDSANSAFQARGSNDIGFEASLSTSNYDSISDIYDFSTGQAMEVVEMGHTQSPTPSNLHLTSVSFNTATLPVATAFHEGLFGPNPADGTWLKPLVFPRNRWIGHITSTEITEMVFKSISRASLLNSTYLSISSTARHRIIVQFITHMNTCEGMRRNSYTWRQKLSMDTTVSPHLYANLLSEESLVGEEHDRFAMLSSDEVFEIRFYTRLIRSMMNGCAGLGNIPISGVLGFLNRHYSMQSTLSRFLQSCPKYAAKSLAETTFRAALEADDVNTAKLLIELDLVDVHKTLCLYKGKPCTPVILAALNESFGVLELLLNLGTDINKSFSPKSDYTVLEQLLNNQNPQSTLSEDFLHLFNLCLEAGATMVNDLIGRVLRGFVDPRPARSVISRLVSQSSSDLVLNTEGCLSEIVRNFDEEEALRMVGTIMKGVRDPRTIQYQMYAPHEIDDALEQAVRHGSQRLVEILIPYSSSPQDAFSAAIEGDDQNLIDIILEKAPDSGSLMTHKAVVAALKSGNHNLLAFLEENGALDRFQDAAEYELIVSEALEMKNPALAKQLLDRITDSYIPLSFKGFGLCAAIDNDYDDFACKLVFPAHHTSSNSGDNLRPFIAAVRKGKAQLVRKMLECNFIPTLGYLNHYDHYDAIIVAALECNNNTILHDILRFSTHLHSTTCSTRALEISYERGDLDLFWKIIKSDNPRHAGLRKALQFAVEREDVPLLRELFRLGAKPDDKQALNEAIHKHPSMIRPLLERFREVYPVGNGGFGVEAISLAISCIPARAEAVDTLLAYKIVDVNVMLDSVTSDIIPRGSTNEKFLKRKKVIDGEIVVYYQSVLGVAISQCFGREARRDDLELVQKLLDAGGDSNSITTGEGTGPYRRTQTALLDAIETGSPQMVQLLLQHGARVNEPASFGLIRTPLQKAAEMDCLDIVRLLLENGADVNAPPALYGGATALQLAAIKGNCTIATILIEHGARLDIPPPQGPSGRWPLEGAAENGRLDMIELIWYASNRQLDDGQCRKAMRLAKSNGHIGCRDRIADLMSNVPAIT